MKKSIILLSVVIAIVLCSCNPEHVDTCAIKFVNNSGYDVYCAKHDRELQRVADGATSVTTVMLKDSSDKFVFYKVDSYIDTIEKGKPARIPVITEPVVSKTVTADIDKTLSITYSAGSLAVN